MVPGGGRLALSTDAYVVHPLEFPGGDIGELAVNGTVNDLAMVGATPLWLTAGFVIEEGFPIADLRRIVASMGAAARAAGVAVVAGDTKVVERGKADGLFVTTAGVGTVAVGVDLGPHRVEPGDRVLLSGTLADHGMAVMVARGDLQLEAEIESDTAAVHELAASLVSLGDGLRWMRDPTRGGLATALNELAEAAGLAVVLDESALPVRPAVNAACEILGIDPLYVANEGKLIAIVAAGGRRRSARRAPGPPARRGGRPARRGARRARRASCCSTPLSGERASSTCWSAIRSLASAEQAHEPERNETATRMRCCRTPVSAGIVENAPRHPSQSRRGRPKP